MTENDGRENRWWIAEYGSPCRECQFDWAQSAESAIASVEGVPDRFVGLLDGRTGDERAPGATWSAKAYVYHVADNLRIFAERLEGVAAGAPRMLAAYDQDELAAARHYEQMSVQSATFLHEERGQLTAAEVTRAPAHDAVHHCWDVRRATGARATGAGTRPVA